MKVKDQIFESELQLKLGQRTFAYMWILVKIMQSKVKHAYFMHITSTCIHLDQWKSFMMFGINKPHEMKSYNLSWIALLSEWNYRSSTKP